MFFFKILPSITDCGGPCWKPPPVIGPAFGVKNGA